MALSLGSVLPATTPPSFALRHTLFDPQTNASLAPSQGDGVEMNRDWIIVGAAYGGASNLFPGLVNIYDRASGRFLLTLTNPSPGLSAQFGWGLAQSGTRVAVGGYWQYAGATNPSRAYVFDLAGPTSMVPVATLTNPNPSYSDHFGVKIAMSGTRIVVPAMRDPTGATNAGAVYLYDLSSPTPGTPVLTLTNPSPAPEDMFGNAVALSGNRLLVGCASDDTGATDAGIVYVYELDGATPVTAVVTLTHPRPAVGNYFGAGAILTDTRAFITARTDGTGGSAGGIVYAYDLASTTPTVPSLVFTNPSPAAGDYFGSVASSGNYVVIGAFLDDTEVQDSGSVYVYDLSGASPTVPVAMLSRPVRASGQAFGYKVAMYDTTIVVGAPWDGTLGQYHGAAYVFELRPALSLVASAPGLATLAWTPSNAPGFALQYSDSVPPTNWVNAPSGAANPVTVATTNTARIYRLAQP